MYKVRKDIELEFSALGGMFANIQVHFPDSKICFINNFHLPDSVENCHPSKMPTTTSRIEKLRHKKYYFVRKGGKNL